MSDFRFVENPVKTLPDETALSIFNVKGIECTDVGRYAATSKENLAWVRANIKPLYAELQRRNPRILNRLHRSEKITLQDYSRACALTKIANNRGFRRNFAGDHAELLDRLRTPQNEYLHINEREGAYQSIAMAQRQKTMHEMMACGMNSSDAIGMSQIGYRSPELQESLTKILLHGGGGPFRKRSIQSAYASIGRSAQDGFVETSDSDSVTVPSTDEAIVRNTDAYLAQYQPGGQTEEVGNFMLQAAPRMSPQQATQFDLDGGERYAYEELQNVKSTSEMTRILALFGRITRTYNNPQLQMHPQAAARLAVLFQNGGFDEYLAPLLSLPPANPANTIANVGNEILRQAPTPEVTFVNGVFGTTKHPPSDWYTHEDAQTMEQYLKSGLSVLDIEQIGEEFYSGYERELRKSLPPDQGSKVKSPSESHLANIVMQVLMNSQPQDQSDQSELIEQVGQIIHPM
jgi:hypothetical protein